MQIENDPTQTCVECPAITILPKMYAFREHHLLIAALLCAAPALGKAHYRPPIGCGVLCEGYSPGSMSFNREAADEDEVVLLRRNVNQTPLAVSVA